MMGSFITRTLVMVLGYAYPAYECFKIVEKNKPEIEQLCFWCQYWILVASLTVFERVGDTFISWLPMYSELKLAFFIYLWYPKTRGTTYIFETFFRPYIAKYETEIDRNLLELRTRAGDVVILYCQKAATYGQTKFLEIMQFVASSSQSQPSKSRPTQKQQQRRQPPPLVHSRKSASAQPSMPRKPLSLVKSQASEPAHDTAPSTLVLPIPVKTAPLSSSSPCIAENTRTSKFSAAPSKCNAGNSKSSAGLSKSSSAGPSNSSEVETTSVPINGDENSSAKESVIEEVIRVTRGRLRKTRSAGPRTTIR